MKLENPKITILVGQEDTTIEVHDSKSNTTFLKLKLTPEQLSSALSRMGRVECEATIVGDEKIGKTHENDVFVFNIPMSWRGSRHGDLIYARCLEVLPNSKFNGWVPDKGFRNQDSFFEEGGECFARAVVRRWI